MDVEKLKSVLRPALVGLAIYLIVPLLVHLLAAALLGRIVTLVNGPNPDPNNNIIVEMGLSYSTYCSWDAFATRFANEPFVLLAEIYGNSLQLVTLIMTNVFQLGFIGLSLNRILKTEDFIAFISFIVVVGGLLAVNILPLILAKLKPGYNSDINSIALRFVVPLISYFPVTLMTYIFVLQYSPGSAILIISGILNVLVWVIVWFSIPKFRRGGAQQ
jgi:hypothetical protein